MRTTSGLLEEYGSWPHTPSHCLDPPWLVDAEPLADHRQSQVQLRLSFYISPLWVDIIDRLNILLFVIAGIALKQLLLCGA